MVDDADAVFANEIQPFLFDGITTEQGTPQFTVLLGEVGAGKSRNVGRLLETSLASAVALRVADLAPFRRDADGVPQLRRWMAQTLDFAREQRVSVILEDSFETPQDATAALELFSTSGFTTRIVAMAAPRAETLLASTAMDVRRQRQDTAWPRSRGGGASGLERLVEPILSSSPAATICTVVHRNGTQETTQSGHAAADLWKRACEAPLPGRAAAEWISELRRLSEQVGRPGTTDPTRTAALVELHQLAVSEVIPRLPLPADSTVRDQLGARIRRDLAELRRRVAQAPEEGGAIWPTTKRRDPSRGPG